MKKLTQILVGILVIGMLCGCATPQATNEALPKIAPAVKTAAMIGTFYALKEHPEWRKGFELAVKELTFIEKAENIDFASVVSIVQRLPVKELQSDEATVAIAGATIVLTEYTGVMVTLDKLREYRPIVTALRSGIQLGLRE